MGRRLVAAAYMPKHHRNWTDDTRTKLRFCTGMLQGRFLGSPGLELRYFSTIKCTEALPVHARSAQNPWLKEGYD